MAKFTYQETTISDDYVFNKKTKPTKCQQLQAFEDDGWEVFSIMKYHASPDWQVVLRKPR